MDFLFFFGDIYEIVVKKLANIGIKPNLYDKIISSGDVCKSELITNTNLVPGVKYYFIGLKEDNDLLDSTKFEESLSPKNSDSDIPKLEKVTGNNNKAEAKMAGITPAVLIFKGR